MTLRFRPRLVFTVAFVAVLLVQAAWMLTVPAFRGIDEFDHVYKAAAVARGQWTARDPAPHGNGGVVRIPGDIVRAASPVCQFYKYTGHDNCFPIRPSAGPEVEVATTANAYNPAYYLLTGLLSRPFRGAGVDYAMRAATAIAAALLMAWAAAVTARWARTAWPLVTLSLGLTPVLVYSTSIASPNGLTYAAAALVWSVLIAMSRPGSGQRGLPLALGVASVTMVATHTTGMLWLVLMGLAALLLRPARDWWSTLRARPGAWTLAAGAVAVGTGLCVAWVRFAHTNSLQGGATGDVAFPWSELPLYHARWALQSIGAFPIRNNPAPAPVYAIYGLMLLAVLGAVLRLGTFRERLTTATILLLLVVVPTYLTLISYVTEGIAWQGRYSLPLWLGITAIGGIVLDRRPMPSWQFLSVLYMLVAGAMTTSTVGVGLREAHNGPADPLASAVSGGFVLASILTLGGCLLPLLVLRTADPRSRTRQTDHATAEACA